MSEAGGGNSVRRVHDQREIETGLAALVIHAGNVVRAAEALRENGTPIARRTLQSWKTQHADRLEEIKREILPTVRERTIGDLSTLVLRFAGTQEKLRAKVDDDAESMNGTDAAKALRDVAVAMGISTEKRLLLAGEPTQIMAGRPDPEALVEQLFRAFGIRPPVDSTASEISEQNSLDP